MRAAQQIGFVKGFWQECNKLNDTITHKIVDNFAIEDSYISNNTLFSSIIHFIGKVGITLTMAGVILDILIVTFPESSLAMAIPIAFSGPGLLLFLAIVFGPLVAGIALQVVACMMYNLVARFNQLFHFEKNIKIKEATIICSELNDHIHIMKDYIRLNEQQLTPETINKLKEKNNKLIEALENNAPKPYHEILLLTKVQDLIKKIKEKNIGLSGTEQALLSIEKRASKQNIISLLENIITNDNDTELGRLLSPKEIPCTKYLKKIKNMSIANDYNKSLEIIQIVNEIKDDNESKPLEDAILESELKLILNQESLQIAKLEDNSIPQQNPIINVIKKVSIQTYILLDALSLGILTFLAGIGKTIVGAVFGERESRSTTKEVIKKIKELKGATYNKKGSNISEKDKQALAKEVPEKVEEVVIIMAQVQESGKQIFANMYDSLIDPKNVYRLQRIDQSLRLKQLEKLNDDSYDKRIIHIQQTLNKLQAYDEVKYPPSKNNEIIEQYKNKLDMCINLTTLKSQTKDGSIETVANLPESIQHAFTNINDKEPETVQTFLTLVHKELTKNVESLEKEINGVNINQQLQEPLANLLTERNTIIDKLHEDINDTLEIAKIIKFSSTNDINIEKFEKDMKSIMKNKDYEFPKDTINKLTMLLNKLDTSMERNYSTYLSTAYYLHKNDKQIKSYTQGSNPSIEVLIEKREQLAKKLEDIKKGNLKNYTMNSEEFTTERKNCKLQTLRANKPRKT